jgi:hypothetical protein
MRRSAVILAVLIAGCSSSGLIDGPVLTAPSEDHGMDALIVGTLLFDADHGCLKLQREGVAAPVVWPAGTTWRPDPPAVVLPDGTIVEPGMQVRGGGGYLPRSNLELRAGSNVAEAAAACRDTTDDDAAVFNSHSDIAVVDG